MQSGSLSWAVFQKSVRCPQHVGWVLVLERRILWGSWKRKPASVIMACCQYGQSKVLVLYKLIPPSAKWPKLVSFTSQNFCVAEMIGILWSSLIMCLGNSLPFTAGTFPAFNSLSFVYTRSLWLADSEPLSLVNAHWGWVRDFKRMP